jgi:hypothetical protein
VIYNHSNRIRFSGYRQRPDGYALFLPGHAGAREPVAEVLTPHASKPEQLPLTWNGDVWESSKTVPLGTAYRFRLSPESEALPLELQETTQSANVGSFNKVAANASQAPERSTVISNIYADSLVDNEQFQKLKAEHGGLPVRNHFDRFGRPEGNERGLEELLPHSHQAGYSAFLLNPFIGGDKISSHGYWTIDPYRLNNSFTDNAAFRDVLNKMLKNGMKLYADGAFVNQGLDGVQMMSNMAHGFRSPYWNWFKYGADHQAAGLNQARLNEGKNADPWDYPSHAHENRKYTFGVLPTTPPDQNGHRRINYDRFAFRILNNPDRAGYAPAKPTFVELYDPLLEDESGRKKRVPSADRAALIRDSEASVQPYRFPVSADEVRQKNKRLHQLDKKHSPQLSQAGEKELLMEWRHFRLSKPTQDDSSVKWDGHVNVALMNTRNPEVVAYLEGAVGYWSRMVMNTYTDTVARALHQAVDGKNGDTLSAPDFQHALEAITQHPKDEGKNIQKEHGKKIEKVLPPITLPTVENVGLSEISSTLRQLHPDVLPQSEGAAFSSRLLREIPLNVLPLPTLFKATLSYPRLSERLKQQELTGWQNAVHGVFSPFVGIHAFGVGAAATAIRDWLAPPSFEKKLGEKLQQSINGLREPGQQKMRYGRMQSLMADKLGESLFLHLLTGLEMEGLFRNRYSAQAIQKAFYAHVPAALIAADPVTGADKLERLLKQRLKKLDVNKVRHPLADALKALDPRMVALADVVLRKREYGLNWRIDAAKDVADMDRVRNAPTSERAATFREEMVFAKRFWDRLGGAMRAPFPKSSLIAELTDFDVLSDKPTEKQVMHELLSGNTFSGAPSMGHLYSQLMQLVNYAQRPDEYGGNQLKPSEFVHAAMQPMSQSVPFTALRQAQNMVSSHDYSTASHALLINPDLFTMDLLKWWGLKDDFNVASWELAEKACFEGLKTEIPTLEDVSKNLRNFLDAPDSSIRQRIRALGKNAQGENRALYQELSAFYNENAKKEDEDSRWVSTPHMLKAPFVDVVFKMLTPEERDGIGLSALTPEAEEKLKQALKARISEPSEAKAMRGVLMNNLLTLDTSKPASTADKPQKTFWDETKAQYALTDGQLQALQTHFKNSMWQALDRTIAQWGRHFGYQPLDIALQHTFANVDSAWTQGIPVFQDHPQQAQAFQKSVQTALSREANRPVLKKLLRLFAVQNALPGNPSVYLPDWLAQGGGEWTQNIFAQNRALIRTDKLSNHSSGNPAKPAKNQADGSKNTPPHQADDPEFQDFLKRAGQIFRTRSQGPTFEVQGKDGQRKPVRMGPEALNDGMLLDIPADDENGVLPIVRDNGQEQVITLVYTGQPQALKDWHRKEGSGQKYAEIGNNLGGLKAYRTRLQSPSLVTGRIYRDMMTGEHFKLNADGALVNQTHPEKEGLDIDDCRVLVREPLQK